MKEIQMVDLRGQYAKIQEEVDAAVIEVMRSTAFINGPAVKAFQKDLENYLNINHVIPCANGTDALQICLMALGLEPGDEVITPSFTYVATAEVIALLRLKPVFVDVDPDTFTILPEAVENAVTEKTKAVMPVHLYGQCADMEEILKVAKKHNLKVIEDTAQAIGAEYTFSDGTVKKAGTMGDCGSTSFFPSKNLGAYGDGGAIFTNDNALAEKIRMTANHGQQKRYYHDIVGVNSRLDSIQAAILNVKLKHLDEYSKARKTAASFYDQAFIDNDSVSTPVRSNNSTHVFHQYTVKLKGVDRDKLQNHLQDKGIPSNIYYPLPVHLQKPYAGNNSRCGKLQNTEKLMDVVLSLPIHTEFDTEQLQYITKTINEFVGINAPNSVTTI